MLRTALVITVVLWSSKKVGYRSCFHALWFFEAELPIKQAQKGFKFTGNGIVETGDVPVDCWYSLEDVTPSWARLDWCIILIVSTVYLHVFMCLNRIDNGLSIRLGFLRFPLMCTFSRNTNDALLKLDMNLNAYVFICSLQSSQGHLPVQSPFHHHSTVRALAHSLRLIPERQDHALHQ